VCVQGDAEEQAELPPTALAVALRNVLRNALEASASDATVTVSVEADGDRVRFDVGDVGSGMSDEVRSRAMDPFYTTKGVGGGMGLGLFLVRALADQLGGELVLESTPGHGTLVSLRLPRTPRSPA
jgi:two-component system sensor histidine kinase RegB